MGGGGRWGGGWGGGDGELIETGSVGFQETFHLFF